MPQNRAVGANRFLQSGQYLKRAFEESSFPSVLNYRYDSLSLNKTFIPGIARSEDYFTAGESLNSIFLATRSISPNSHKQSQTGETGESLSSLN